MRLSTLERIASTADRVLHPHRGVRNSQELAQLLRAGGVTEHYTAAREVVDTVASGGDLKEVLERFGVSGEKSQEMAEYLSNASLHGRRFATLNNPVFASESSLGRVLNYVAEQFGTDFERLGDYASGKRVLSALANSGEGLTRAQAGIATVALETLGEITDRKEAAQLARLRQALWSAQSNFQLDPEAEAALFTLEQHLAPATVANYKLENTQPWSAKKAIQVATLLGALGLQGGIASAPIAAQTTGIDYSRGAVVQIGEGDQVYTEDIRFYPDRTEVRPGETVNWRLEIPGLKGPFVIIPEMNNDTVREPTKVTSETSILLPYTYTTANIYVPFLTVRDATGTTRTIYTTNVLGVIPDLEQRVRLGIKLPTPEDPTGDVIKGIQLIDVDPELITSEEGKRYMQEQIGIWKEANVNFVLLNIPLFVKQIDSNVTLPYYGKIWPIWPVSTISIDSLIYITDALHNRGIRVGFRTFMVEEEDYATSSRYNFNPSNVKLYFHYHTQIKRTLALLAEQLAVEMFNLDAENPVTSLSVEAIPMIASIREVYSGVVCDTAVIDRNVLLRSPLLGYLDLLYISQGPNFDELGQRPQSDYEGSFYTQMSQDIVPILYELKLPGLLETFVEFLPNQPSNQEKGYYAILGVMSEYPSLLTGCTFWDVPLDQSNQAQFNPFNRPAQNILSDYFGQILPEFREYRFLSPFSTPSVSKILLDFNSGVSRDNFWVYESNGTIVVANERNTHVEGTGSIAIKFTLSEPQKPSMYLLTTPFRSPQNWSQYNSLTIWVKSDGTPGEIAFDIWDNDGDRFYAEVNTPTMEKGWAPLTIRLRDFCQPSWSQKNDGILDLTRITRFAIGQKSSTATNMITTYFDKFYLGEE